MTIWWKIALFCLAEMVVFSSGVYTENKFNIAKQVGVANAQTKRVADGQAKIIDFNQKWSKARAKSVDCPIPPDQLELLR